MLVACSTFTILPLAASSGRWSRRGREVLLGKQHLHPFFLPERTFAVRRTLGADCARSLCHAAGTTDIVVACSTLTLLPLAASSGRWSRRAREVLLGKQHLHPFFLPERTFAVRRTLGADCARSLCHTAGVTDMLVACSTFTILPLAASSGRWSRRGREVLLGKQHLQNRCLWDVVVSGIMRVLPFPASF